MVWGLDKFCVSAILVLPLKLRLWGLGPFWPFDISIFYERNIMKKFFANAHAGPAPTQTFLDNSISAMIGALAGTKGD